MALHLVTGGSGFVGTNLVRLLLDRGESVRIVDVIEDPNRQREAEFQKIDILDMPALQKAMVGVDYVHHNAALVPIRKAGRRFFEVNVQGTRNTLEAAKTAGVKHFSHMSSSSIFGSVTKKDCPIKEGKDLQPVEVYGQSKLDAESFVATEMEKPGMSCSIIRPRCLMGPGRLGIFQILFDWIANGKNIYVIGDGKNQLQFLHIDDLVEVSIQSALQQKSGYYNVGAENFCSLNATLETLILHADTKSKVRHLPVTPSKIALYTLDKMGLSPLSPFHYLTYHRDFYFDVSHTKNRLAWKPQYSNTQMFHQSYDWYIANRDKLGNTSAHKSPLQQGVLRLLRAIS